MIATEYCVARARGRELYRFQDTVTSLNAGLVSQFVNVVGGAFSVYMYSLMVGQFGLFTLSASDIWVWIVALVLYDFCYYWVHRAGHEVNLFWASHVIHHSSEDFNLATALRQSATGFYFKWAFYLPLAVLGIPTKVFVVVALIDLLYQYWVIPNSWVEWDFWSDFSSHRPTIVYTTGRTITASTKTTAAYLASGIRFSAPMPMSGMMNGSFTGFESRFAAGTLFGQMFTTTSRSVDWYARHARGAKN